MRRSTLIQSGEHIDRLDVSWKTADLEPENRRHQILRKAQGKPDTTAGFK
jgi:hypothetical protein